MIHELVYLDTEINRGISTYPNRWIIFKTTKFTNGIQALHAFLYETSYPYIKLVSANSQDELQMEKLKIIEQYNNNQLNVLD